MKRALLLGAAIAVGASGAHARALTTADVSTMETVLGNFNLVTYGNYAATNESEGPIAIGGNMTGGTPNIGFNNQGRNLNQTINGRAYGVANIWGNISSTGLTTNGSGDIYIGGTALGVNFGSMNRSAFNIVGAVNSNTRLDNPSAIRTSQSSFPASVQNGNPNPTPQLNLPASTVFPGYNASSASKGFSRDFGAPLNNLSTVISNLATLANVTPTQLNATRLTNQAYSVSNTPDWSPNVQGTVFRYAFLELGIGQLANVSNFGGFIVPSGIDAVFVNVTGGGQASSINLSSVNFNPNQNDQSKVIWNFNSSGSISFNQWFGTILAPRAAVTNNGNLTGPVVVKTLTQNSELHFYTTVPGNRSNAGFSGRLGGIRNLTVPSPASLGLFGLGAAAVTLRSRRRAIG
jgi:choice-of-anchor A domain-containing protein